MSLDRSRARLILEHAGDPALRADLERVRRDRREREESERIAAERARRRAPGDSWNLAVDGEEIGSVTAISAPAALMKLALRLRDRDGAAADSRRLEAWGGTHGESGSVRDYHRTAKHLREKLDRVAAEVPEPPPAGAPDRAPQSPRA